ncbi:MAG: type II and III secretion system protein family protein [Rhodospirillales bacterium]|nr:type II and III secretion system protein family protein [Rhodospirillales bacterium]
MMRAPILIRALMLAFVWAPPAVAQTPPGNEPPPPKASPQPKVTIGKPGNPAPLETKAPAGAIRGQPALAAPAPEVARPVASQVMRLPLNKSRLIELPADARDVLVAGSDMVDVVLKTPRQVFLFARAVGDTNIVFLDRAGQVIHKLELHVHVDIESLRATLAQILPGEDVQAHAVGDNIFLSGNVRSDVAAASARAVARPFVAEDAKLINLLKVQAEQQVLLRVRVAEVQKSALKELGIETSVSPGQALNVANLRFDLTPATSGAITSSTNALFRSTINQRNRSTGGTSPFQFAIKALERRGMVKTLAEPNLTAISGETAKLLAGGEYPIPIAETNGQISVEFKPFGVGLAFTPVVLGNGRISLKLSSEVSAIDSNLTVAVSSSTSVPGLKVRRAESTVELPSGGSLMIAGLLQNDITNSITGIPGLKDVPILGALFRSTSFQRAESELVVTVTAYVVRPGSDSDFALPTDGLVPSSDLDQYLFGQLYHAYRGNKGPPPPLAIEGPFGSILE